MENTKICAGGRGAVERDQGKGDHKVESKFNKSKSVNIILSITLGMRISIKSKGQRAQSINREYKHNKDCRREGDRG